MNVRVTNTLEACHPFTPRVFAANVASTDAKPVTYFLTSGGTKAGNIITCTTSVAHGLVVGDSISFTGAVNHYADGRYTVASVPSTTSFTIKLSNAVADANADGTYGVASVVADVWFSRAAVYGKTTAGASNAFGLTIGYSSTLLPITLAVDGEYGFVAPDGRRMNLADLYVKPDSAGTNGLICILY